MNHACHLYPLPQLPMDAAPGHLAYCDCGWSSDRSYAPYTPLSQFRRHLAEVVGDEVVS